MKTLIIVLDGASYDFFNNHKKKFNFIKDNNLKRMDSVIPTGTCPAAVSLFTGLNPLQLNLKNFVNEDGEIINRNKIKAKFLWDYLSDFNYKCCILFTPLTYPVESLNGVLISGYGTPSNKCNFTYPENIKLDFKIPDFNKMTLGSLEQEDENLIESFKKITNERFKIFKEIQEKYNYEFDFSILYIHETDSLQHYFFNDERKLLNYFSHFEKKFNEINKEKFDNIFIISDHGMKLEAKRRFFINTFLKQKDLLEYKNKRRIFNKLVSYSKGLLKKDSMFTKLKVKLEFFNYLTQKIAKKKDKLVLSNIDYKKSEVYAKDAWGLYVKDKKNVSKVKQELAKLRYNSKIIIKKIYEKSEIYNSENNESNENFPDLIIQFSDDFEGNALEFDNCIEEKEKFFHYGRELIATHSIKGIFINYKSNVLLKNNSYNILNIVPSLLKLYQIPIPLNIFGKSFIYKDKKIENKTRNEIDLIKKHLLNIENI